MFSSYETCQCSLQERSRGKIGNVWLGADEWGSHVMNDKFVEEISSMWGSVVMRRCKGVSRILRNFPDLRHLRGRNRYTWTLPPIYPPISPREHRCWSAKYWNFHGRAYPLHFDFPFAYYLRFFKFKGYYHNQHNRVIEVYFNWDKNEPHVVINDHFIKVLKVLVCRMGSIGMSTS